MLALETEESRSVAQRRSGEVENKALRQEV